ncbi:hypothetical protein KQ1_05843 [Bacillus cereus BAG3O-1]|nr:hypothetical protein KQ1_05843 [Bacillus cereus BAG3O-1]
MTTIIPKQSLATHNVTKQFEKISTDIFYYVQLGLIKPFDIALYVKYLELFNENYGYAFPTIYQLEDYMNCSRQSIVSANKRLVTAGLLIMRKHKNNNNIIEETGEFIIYSCAPRYVKQMMVAADVFSVPIKVIDIVNGYPSAANLIVINYEIIKYIINYVEC